MVSAELPVLVSTTFLEIFPPALIAPKSMLSGTNCTVPAVRVSVAVADLVGSVTEVAVKTTTLFEGTAAGAVYVVGVVLRVLAAERVPHAGEHAV
jgi:hypothetical protein